MCHDEFLCDDVAHAHFSVILAVPDGSFVLLLAFELEDQHLLAAVVARDGAGNLVVRGLGAGQHFARVAKDRQNFRKLDLGTDIARQLGHTDHIAGCNPKLFSAGLNNGMHGESLNWEARTQEAAGLNGVSLDSITSGGYLTNPGARQKQPERDWHPMMHGSAPERQARSSHRVNGRNRFRERPGTGG